METIAQNSKLSVFELKEYNFNTPGFYKVDDNGILKREFSRDIVSANNGKEASHVTYLVINSKYYRVDDNYIFVFRSDSNAENPVIYRNKHFNPTHLIKDLPIEIPEPTPQPQPTPGPEPEPVNPPAEEKDEGFPTWAWILIIILILVIIVSVIVYFQCKKKIYYKETELNSNANVPNAFDKDTTKQNLTTNN